MNKNSKVKVGFVALGAFVMGWLIYPFFVSKEQPRQEDLILEKINNFSSFIEDGKVSDIMSLLNSDFKSVGVLSVSNKEQLYPIVSRLLGIYSPLHGVAINPEINLISDFEAISTMDYLITGENDTGLFAQKSKRFQVEINWIKINSVWKLSSVKVFETK